MSIPTFDEFLLPFLELLSEHGRLSLKQARGHLAERLNVSEEAQRELLPSGKQRRFDNRVGWAQTYLSKAGLTRSVSRGVYELTPDGRELVANRPGALDLSALRRFESFRAWEEMSRRGAPSRSAPATEANEDPETPEEAIEEAFGVLRANLTDELAEALQGVSWGRFEDIVIDALLALGYGGSRAGAGHAFRKSGDGGVDGVINEDRLGLSKIYVQAKRYAPENRVGRPDVQAFVGSLLGQRAKQGVFITTSSFSSEAANYVESLHDQRVILIDGEQLAEYMIDHDVGVNEHERFVIKRLDRDYFEED